MEPPRILTVSVLVLALLTGPGCVEPPPECTTVHSFEWDAPGLYDRLTDDVPWDWIDAPAGPGIAAPQTESFLRFGDARISSIRYSDPDAALRNANIHFGSGDTMARIVVTVPGDDDRPEPLFDALWDALDPSADRESTRQSLLETRADTGHLVSYQAEVDPSIQLESWLAARGGMAAGDESTKQLGVVHIEWDDWRMELRTPWRAWTFEGQEAPHRLQAMPHGAATLLVDARLGWTPSEAVTWMRGQASVRQLPDTGLDAIRSGPIDQVCA